MIQDKILNNFPVRKSDHRTGDADTSICVRFLSITIRSKAKRQSPSCPSKATPDKGILVKGKR